MGKIIYEQPKRRRKIGQNKGDSQRENICQNQSENQDEGCQWHHASISSLSKSTNNTCTQ